MRSLMVRPFKPCTPVFFHIEYRLAQLIDETKAMDPKILDDISRRIAAALPPGVSTIKADLEKNIRAALDGVIGNMNLVSRQEFDVQQKVLERTRIKLEALEKQLAELEKNI
jgi:BMFP domain-containing protein YqiC